MKRRLIIVLWLTCYLPVLLTFFCPRLEEELSRDFVISPLKLKFRLLLNYYFIIHTNSFKIWWWKRRLLNQISNPMPITISSTFPCTLMFCSPPGSSRTCSYSCFTQPVTIRATLTVILTGKDGHSPPLLLVMLSTISEHKRSQKGNFWPKFSSKHGWTCTF